MKIFVASSPDLQGKEILLLARKGKEMPEKK
jgi:hypothetical protein